jgi:hypothetical protein
MSLTRHAILHFGRAGKLEPDGRRARAQSSATGPRLKTANPTLKFVTMCRNIRPLFNFEPPATDEEIHAAALQFVRKVSGTRTPRGNNQLVFEDAVREIAAVTRRLVDSLETSAAPKNREIEAVKAKARSIRRFG